MSSESSRSSLNSLYSYAGSTNSLYGRGFLSPHHASSRIIYSSSPLTQSSNNLLKTTIKENSTHVSSNNYACTNDEYLSQYMVNTLNLNKEIDRLSPKPKQDSSSTAIDSYYAVPVNTYSNCFQHEHHHGGNVCEKLLDFDLLR